MLPSKSDLVPYLEKYGSHCMAYTSLEPSLEYFFVKGIGYIAFKRFKHWFWARVERTVVLADPVCAPGDFNELLDLFLKKHSNPIFVQCSKAFAKVLDDRGFQVNQFGIETNLSIKNFDLKGKARAKLRQWRNKCQREGVCIVETNIEEYPDMKEVDALSKRWLDKKGGEEYSFLVRPLRCENEKDVRYFWAYIGEGDQRELVGFSVFDPMYRNGKLVAYYHNIDRFDSKAPHGTSASIVLHALSVFEKEGVETVSLGMSPLCLQKGLSSEFNFNMTTRRAFWYAFDKLNFIYPFKGNASHKKKFAGTQLPVYISSAKGTNLWQVLVMMKSNELF